MKLVAILQNAYKIGYEVEINNVGRCWFTLPLNDTKQSELTSKRFVEIYDHHKRIGMFVINPKKTIKNESDNSITYNCEHVLATLHSDILFKAHQFTNLTTEAVLAALLDKQQVKHWKLGRIEFTRYFHYFFENEDSLLNAVVSIPNPFDEQYQFTWDDTSYPFTLNLVRPTSEKVDTIRYGKNLKGIEKEEDPSNLITRIYPLGYGEGVNQLTIETVNNGIPYLEAPKSIVDQYGTHKRIWVDRRFKDPQSLKDSAQSLLKRYQQPIISIALDCADYELMDPYKVVKYDIAKIVNVYDEDTDTNEDLRIVKISKSDIYGDLLNIKMEIGNVREDIGDTITDLQKKQLVNDTYSQGATNIDSYTFNDNVDESYPAIIEFPFPEDMINLNESKLLIKTSKFRAYSKGTKSSPVQSVTSAAGGGVVQSTSSGGGTTVSSSSGGGSVQTSSAGGGISTTTSNGGGSTETSSTAAFSLLMFESEDHIGDVGARHRHGIRLNGENFDHSHTVTVKPHAHNLQVPAHSHTTSIPAHQHTVSISPHAHSVEIEPHSHEITLPAHQHDIEYGIYEYENLPNKLTIKIDGVAVPFSGLEGEIDVIPYLSKENGGKVTRGYHTIEVMPDNLARINLVLSNRFFVQSLEGGIY